jgi:cell wall-associated NlpC family hydrolase
VNLSDSSYKQAKAGGKVVRDEMVPGDFIFFLTKVQIHP